MHSRISGTQEKGELNMNLLIRFLIALLVGYFYLGFIHPLIGGFLGTIVLIIVALALIGFVIGKI